MLKRALAAAAGAVALTGMQAPEATVFVSPQRNWSATLRMDAQALHDDIAANHPGPVNPEDPGFARRNEAQLRLALKRAETARSFAGYNFALKAYVAAFDDGHLDYGLYRGSPLDVHWPGFLTAYEADGMQRVASRADAAPVPLGARLLGCDGRSAERLAQENLGRFSGRWALLSQRLSAGKYLFVDEHNPYIRRPARCMFDVAGRRRVVRLDWQPIDFRDLLRRFWTTAPERQREFVARTLGDGTRWIAIASFNGDPATDSGRALPPLIASLRANRTALAAAPAIVLDLRRNDGGSSDWSRQIAEIIWGRAAIDRLPRGAVRIDWRASAANLASLRESRESRIAGGALSPEERRWFDSVTTGLAGALAHGEPLWRELPAESDAGRTAAGAADGAAPRLNGPVYFITDAGCASACLDAVDLWRALGAIHLGQTTSADTLYMDVRHQSLPSGLARITVPMKVYRGRPRGANQPVVPVHGFTGDIADTAALERWIAGLGERRR